MGEAGPDDTDLSSFQLRNSKGTAELRQATRQADLHLTMDGATTLRLTVHDPQRKIISQDWTGELTTAVLDGRLFELVNPKKTGSTLTFEFEDAAVADLRRVTKAAAVRNGTTTRVGYATRIVAAPGWLRLVSPAGPTEQVAFSQGGDEDEEPGWDALDRLFVSDLRWRRFSLGRDIVVAPDPWLFARAKPVPLREHFGAVDDIDFDVDSGKTVHRATVYCQAARWLVPPGSPVELPPTLGPAKGEWLVETIDRSLFSTRATVGLTRVAEPLPPPKVEPRDDGGPSDLEAGEAGGAVTAGPVSSQGFSWPLSGTISSPYGQRGGRLHAGLDIAVPIGTPVLAAADGVVGHAGEAGGYGIAVYLDHGGTDTRYAHLSRLLVRTGQQVRRGERIALSGNTGRSSGPHLHFEVRPGGRAANPMSYLPSRR